MSSYIFIVLYYRGNISPANEILTRGFKSEKMLFTERSKTHRFIKRAYESRTNYNRAEQKLRHNGARVILCYVI